MESLLKRNVFIWIREGECSNLTVTNWNIQINKLDISNQWSYLNHKTNETLESLHTYFMFRSTNLSS